jgi:hypothetical protein
MRITQADLIAGRPILQVRKLMRSMSLDVGPETAQRIFSIEEAEALALMEALEAGGYVQPYELARSGSRRWQLTQKGKVLAAASTAPPIHRRTADRLLREFMERVEQVREDSELMFAVGRVIVFGSYLTPKDRLGDLDVALDLRPRPSQEDQFDWAARRIDQAVEQGRRFDNLADRYTWPEVEVLRLLRARSRALSIQQLQNLDEVFEGVPHVVLYEHPGPVRWERLERRG